MPMQKSRVLGLLFYSLLGLGSCLLIVALVFPTAFTYSLHQAHWRITKPDYYRAEISISIQGNRSQISIFVDDDTVAIAHPIATYEALSKRLFQGESITLDSFFTLVAEHCLQKAIDCVIGYDSNYSYIETLAIYDWLVIEVTAFRDCDQENRQACEGDLSDQL